HREARARAAADRADLAAHRRPGGVRALDEIRGAARNVIERTGEEADHGTRAARGVRLAPLESAEDGVARVLLRPRDGEAARIRVDLVADLRRRRAVVASLAARPVALRDAAARAVVVVRATDEAHAERIRAEGGLEGEPVLERLADEVPAGILRDR